MNALLECHQHGVETLCTLTTTGQIILALVLLGFIYVIAATAALLQG